MCAEYCVNVTFNSNANYIDQQYPYKELLIITYNFEVLPVDKHRLTQNYQIVGLSDYDLRRSDRKGTACYNYNDCQIIV